MTSTSTHSSPNPNLAAALAYAERGWHVFPLRPGSKKPAVPTHPADRCDGTDPRCRDGHTGWEQRATSCPDRIIRAWTSAPGYGIGIACGPSGLLVIDTDRPKPGDPVPARWAAPVDGSTAAASGEDVLAELVAGYRDGLPPTWTTSTPSGGVHRYFTNTAALGNSAGLLGWLIDTRGAGGYVAAPPTTTPTGVYQLVHDDDPEPLPQWLMTALTRPTRAPGSTSSRCLSGTESGRQARYVAAALAHELGRVSHAPPGTRNQALFTSALALGQLVGAGALGAEHVTTALHDAAAAHVATGAFTTAEAAATIASGLRRGIADPRRLPTAGRDSLGRRDRQESA